MATPSPIDLRRLKWSTHAHCRGQQRGISPDAVEAVVWYGHRYWAGDGCVAYHLGRKAIAAAGRTVASALDRYRDMAVILAPDGVVVSVQHTPRPKRRWKP